MGARTLVEIVEHETWNHCTQITREINHRKNGVVLVCANKDFFLKTTNLKYTVVGPHHKAYQHCDNWWPGSYGISDCKGHATALYKNF